MMPKLPLTSTTRLLVKELDSAGMAGEPNASASATTASAPSDADSALVRHTHRQSYRKSLTEEVATR